MIRKNLARFNLSMIWMLLIPLLVLAGAYWFGRHPDLRILFILATVAAAVLFLNISRPGDWRADFLRPAGAFSDRHRHTDEYQYRHNPDRRVLVAAAGGFARRQSLYKNPCSS